MLIAETPTFTRQADELFCEDEKRELFDVLAGNPLAGEEIPGTNGIRRLRFSAVGEGRRGGGRAIYYYPNEGIGVYALLACAQSADTDLTPEESGSIFELAAVLGSTVREST